MIIVRLVLISVFLLIPISLLAEEYRVGEGDILYINVYENEDLKTTARISSNGTIRVPLIGEIPVKDLTVSQVSTRIATRLADGYLVDPQVDVFIKEYRSKQAVILGQIRNPGQYELQGPITFLEFISKAGGLAVDAGKTAIVKRTGKDGNPEGKIVVDLERLIEKGDTTLNIDILNNDSIYISKAETYYVTGEVQKPDSYKLESDITIIKAITKAGGFSKIAAKDKVRIIRTVDGEKKVYETVNMDTPVFPGDVIVVPESLW
jgi:polysaccharide export outer membrane protein